MVSSLFLKKIIVLHCTTEGGSLFYYLKTLLVKKNLVQLSSFCLYLNLISLLPVPDKSSIENRLFASTFVNTLSSSILIHSIIFPLRRRFSRERTDLVVPTSSRKIYYARTGLSSQPCAGQLILLCRCMRRLPKLYRILQMGSY